MVFICMLAETTFPLVDVTWQGLHLWRNFNIRTIVGAMSDD